MIEQRTTLPSIAHLFTSLGPSSPLLLPSTAISVHVSPTLNLSPPSPQLENASFVLSPPHSPSLQADPSLYISSSSPLLSPIHSPFSQLPSPIFLTSPPKSSSWTSLSFPPLQGYDPPQLLVKCSSNLSGPPHQLSTWPYQRRVSHSAHSTHLFPHFYTHKHPFLYVSRPLSAPMTTAREDTVTHASISTNTSTRTETPQIHRKHLRSHSLSVPDTTLINTVPLQPRNTQTQTSFHMSKEPPLKRRRGRPLSTGNSTWEGGWVFMTPTVWSVVAPLQPVTASSLLPSYGLEAQGDMATAFTNATMDTILYMPKKKRGRKPKTQMAGNSCFVWKEIKATRTVKPKHSTLKDNPILGTEQLLKYNTLSKVGD